MKVWEAFVARALRDRTFFLRFKAAAKPAMFKDTVLANVYSLLSMFVDDYNKVPTADELAAYTRKLPASEKERIQKYADAIEKLYGAPPEFTEDVLVGEVEEAIKTSRLTDLARMEAAMIDAGVIDYDEILKQTKEIVGFKVDQDLGSFVKQDADALMAKASEEERLEPIRTGVLGLDKVLGGGWRKQQFICGIGSSGIGKSTFLVNHAWGALAAGKRVLHLTVELQEISVVERFFRRITKLSREDMSDGLDFVHRFFDLSGSDLVVKYFRPGTLMVDDVEAYLDRLELMTKFVPDILVIDYLDEMKPSPSDGKKDVRHQHRGIARDLTNLAKVRNVAVLTMTQTNRQALGKKLVTEKDIGEDYGKVQVSDIVFAICQTQDEYGINQARIRLLKNRDGPGRGLEIPVFVDYGKMFVKGLHDPKPFSEM